MFLPLQILLSDFVGGFMPLLAAFDWLKAET